jgi:hypothetical protein
LGGSGSAGVVGSSIDGVPLPGAPGILGDDLREFMQVLPRSQKMALPDIPGKSRL